MLVLNSRISIGGFTFSGVHEVRISRSIHSLIENATIRLPARARIVRKANSNPELVVTASQFIEGDKVTIQLGYNNRLQTEFEGYVYRINQEMPLEVVCEGSSWLLRRTNVNYSADAILLSSFLKKAVKGTSVKTICVSDFQLNNVQLNGSGLDALQELDKYTDGGLSCFFIEPATLWCGPVYHAFARGKDVFENGTVNYRKGFNTPMHGALKWRSAAELKTRIAYNKRLDSGLKISAESSVYSSPNHIVEKVLNHITSPATLKLLANENACRLNYTGYEGSLTGFLQPFAQPGYIVQYEDAAYPTRNGNYLVESTEVTFGMNGARRRVEPGPRLNFLNEQR